MLSNIKDAILALDRPTPRYTSYPTAPHFEAGFEENAYIDWLESLPPGSPLSLYLHIPFCPKLCWFCGCHTKITQRYAPVEDYLHLLIREAERLGSICARRHQISTLHFGGGSPTIIRSQDFQTLMSRLRKFFPFSKDINISVEIDPRNMTEGKAASYAKAGVNRASLGIQDFNEQVMESVNRPQPFHAAYESVRFLRDYGIEKINLDMMYGLPHQTVDSIRRSAELALLLKPDRLTLFGYAHVPWMKRHMRLIPIEALPDPPERIELYEAAASVFTKAGFEAIGIDHFARPDDNLTQVRNAGNLRRNFQGYTDDPADVLLGLGASAISRLPQGFVQNAVAMPSWREHILAGRLPVEKRCALSDEDRLREDVITTLMCQLTADVPSICARHGFERDHLKREMDSLAGIERSGLIEIKKGAVHILYPHAARPVCAAFDAYLQPSETARHVTIT